MAGLRRYVSSEGAVCRAGRGGWWLCIVVFTKWPNNTQLQTDRCPKLPHCLTPYVGVWWRDMRAGGSTKTSSDLGSLSPGALSARVDSRREKAYRGGTAHDPTPLVSDRAWLPLHLEIARHDRGLTLCQRLARRSGTQ